MPSLSMWVRAWAGGIANMPKNSPSRIARLTKSPNSMPRQCGLANDQTRTHSSVGVLAAMKIYLAGPNVFRFDAKTWANAARELCRQYGFEALTPIDHCETEARKWTRCQPK